MIGRGLGEAQRVFGTARTAQQLEAFRPAHLEVRLRGEDDAIRPLRVTTPALLRQPARADDGPLARDVGEEIERSSRTHGPRI